MVPLSIAMAIALVHWDSYQVVTNHALSIAIALMFAKNTCSPAQRVFRALSIAMPNHLACRVPLSMDR